MIELAALLEACAPNAHPVTMQAIVTHESRRNPFAIGINEGPRLAEKEQPTTKAEAIAIAERLEAEGVSWDGGLGQISNANFAWLGFSLDDVFDPCANLAGSARVLEECYARAVQRTADEQAALRAALSCYNTGNFEDGFQNGYVSHIESQLQAGPGYRVPMLSLDEKASSPLLLTVERSQRARELMPLEGNKRDVFQKTSSRESARPSE